MFWVVIGIALCTNKNNVKTIFIFILFATQLLFIIQTVIYLALF